MVGGVVRLTRVDAGPSRQGMVLRGVLALPADVPAEFVPAKRGAQLLVEDLGSGPSALIEMTARTTPIRPGLPGTGCGPRDGWRGNTYRNLSNALDPPVCFAGSAHGLTLLRMKDRRVRGGGIAFRAVLAGATIPAPVGPLRVTLVLSAEAAAGLAGECGTVAFPPQTCVRKRRTYTCR